MAKLSQGLIQVYTGDGKGKSTAAFGQALRAAGRGMKVRIVQFMKASGGYGEELAFARLRPEVEFLSYGSGKWVKKGAASPEDLKAAHDALEAVATAFVKGDYDMVVLDEINNALYFEVVTMEEVLELLKQKPAHTEVVLTGRNAPEAILDMADLVTEMKELKHPYRMGIGAREGIEF